MFSLGDAVLLVVTPVGITHEPSRWRFHVSFLLQKYTPYEPGKEQVKLPGHWCLGVLTDFGINVDTPNPEREAAEMALRFAADPPWRDFGGGGLTYTEHPPSIDDLPASWSGQEKAWWRIHDGFDWESEMSCNEEGTKVTWPNLVDYVE
jgi:hypothetical protein